MLNLTPNVKRLLLKVMAKNAIPDGAGMKEVLDFLSSGDKISAGIKKAEKEVEEYIDKIRNAGGNNPYRNLTDEEIAKVIMDGVDKKEK